MDLLCGCWKLPAPSAAAKLSTAVESLDRPRPIRLVGEVRDDDLRTTREESGGRGSRAAVMDDHGGLREEVSVGTGSDDGDRLVFRRFGRGKPARLNRQRLALRPSLVEMPELTDHGIVRHASEGEEGAAGDGGCRGSGI